MMSPEPPKMPKLSSFHSKCPCLPSHQLILEEWACAGFGYDSNGQSWIDLIDEALKSIFRKTYLGNVHWFGEQVAHGQPCTFAN